MMVKKKAVAAAAPKVLLKTEDDYEPVNRWWEKEDGALSGKRGAKKWDTFEHHGLLFAPDYESHGIPIRYDGKRRKSTSTSTRTAKRKGKRRSTRRRRKRKKRQV